MPDRPVLRVISPDASPEEMAAITAAIEVVRHERAHAAARAAASVTGGDPEHLDAWVRAARLTARRLLATIATANDVHFGEVECGRIGDLGEEELGPILRAEPGDPPYPEVMNGAVIDEMRGLDPDVVVVKGDLTDAGTEDEFESF